MTVHSFHEPILSEFLAKYLCTELALPIEFQEFQMLDGGDELKQFKFVSRFLN